VKTTKSKPKKNSTARSKVTTPSTQKTTTSPATEKTTKKEVTAGVEVTSPRIATTNQNLTEQSHKTAFRKPRE